MLLNFNYSSLKIEETIKFILRILYCQMRYQDILNMEKKKFLPPSLLLENFDTFLKISDFIFYFFRYPIAAFEFLYI